MSTDLLAKLIDAGTPAALVAEVAMLAAQAQAAQAAIEARRASDRARKARQTPVSSREDTGEDVSPRSAPPPLPPSPPDPPYTPNPTTRIESEARALFAWWPRDGFNRFWLRYPRKKAKADAEKAYRKAERTPSLTFAALMAGLDRLIESDPDPQFIPYPASWLNAGQWADEPDPAPKPRLPDSQRSNSPEARNANDVVSAGARLVERTRAAEAERTAGASGMFGQLRGGSGGPDVRLLEARGRG